jgi:hypothetical protein
MPANDVERYASLGDQPANYGTSMLRTAISENKGSALLFSRLPNPVIDKLAKIIGNSERIFITHRLDRHVDSSKKLIIGQAS